MTRSERRRGQVSETYRDDLRALLDAGNAYAALQMAAKMQNLGDHADAIRTAWSAVQRPELYRQMGRDIDALKAAGVAAIRERWKIEA
jgi:hypothetical protein